MAHNQIIPDDIIFNNIFSGLPSKSLCKFRAVSKTWYNEIDQFLRRHRSLASGWISLRDGGVVFFSALHDAIHVCDPFLEFVTDPVRFLCSSTNGLLCLRGFKERLYVCNPVTRQGHIIPDSKFRYAVGLMFEPSISPYQYKLVNPIIRRHPERIEVQFEVFSSLDKKWVKSHAQVTARFSYQRLLVFSSLVVVKEIVYWNWTKNLLWFDCSKDIGGYIKFPLIFYYPACQQLGIWEKRLSCIRLEPSGKMYVWVLADINSSGGVWDTMYQLSLPPYPTMIEKTHPSLAKLFVFPLPFEGGEKVFLREKYIMHKICQGVRARMLSWDLKTGEVSEVSNGELIGLTYVCGYDNSSLVSLTNNWGDKF